MTDCRIINCSHNIHNTEFIEKKVKEFAKKISEHWVITLDNLDEEFRKQEGISIRNYSHEGQFDQALQNLVAQKVLLPTVEYNSFCFIYNPEHS